MIWITRGVIFLLVGLMWNLPEYGWILSSGIASGHPSDKTSTEDRPGEDPSEKFTDHGVASPCAHPRGMIATVDGEGNNVLMIWLFDHRGSYGLLMVDVKTGHSQQFDMPFDIGGDAVYTSILASNGKLYTLYNSHFAEFDPRKRAFTFQSGTTPRMAMSMTEDDEGYIWAVTYPNSGLVRFNPHTYELKDYGSLNRENWAQYPRYIAADDSGWIYFALGNTNRQIIAFDPQTGDKFPVLESSERGTGMAYLYRNTDGKVYGQSTLDEKGEWYEMYRGLVRKIGTDHEIRPKPFVTGSQSLQHMTFPDGHRVESVDMIGRSLSVLQPDSTTSSVDFNYDTDGSWVMNVVTSPDNKCIIGGSSFPFRMFQYDPTVDSWERRSAYGQFNAFATNETSIFFGSYPHGDLVEWDYKNTRLGESQSAQSYSKILYQCDPVVYRPHRVLTTSDQQIVVMGGTPQYGYTGGGLLIYDLSSREGILLNDSAIVVDQSTKSMTQLSDRVLLGGTTTSPGTGGEKKADQAVLYTLSRADREVTWKASLLPGVQDYSDLITRDDGLVYGIADYDVFFVFDPATRDIIYQNNFREQYGRAVASQSPQIFVKGDNEIFVLLQKGIFRVNETTFDLELLDYTPQPITTGGAYLDDRIYYISGSHLYSYGPI